MFFSEEEMFQVDAIEVLQSASSIKYWDKVLNTCAALVLTSIYVNTGDRNAFEAVMNKDYKKVLDYTNEIYNEEYINEMMLLVLAILERLNPSHYFQIGRAPDTDFYIPIIDINDDIAYVLTTDSTLDERVEGNDQLLSELDLNFEVKDIVDLRQKYPDINQSILQQALASNSDFVSILGDNRDAIRDVMNIKTIRVINAIKYDLDKQMGK